MVIRRLWYESLARKEPIARTRATELCLHSNAVPVDLHFVGRNLCAEIRQSTTEEDRDGFLKMDEGKWVVYVRDDPNYLGPAGRATVAHEFAHILFTLCGLGQPTSYAEYWLLEDACDRVGSYFLAPFIEEECLFFTSKDILTRFSELTNRWMLTSYSAVQMMQRISQNLIAAVSLRSNLVGSLVDWSLSSGLCKDWPQEREPVVDGPLADIHEEIKDIHGRSTTITIPGGCLVGLGYLQPTTAPQLRIQFSNLGPGHADESCLHRTVIFSLLGASHGGQMSFGF